MGMRNWVWLVEAQDRHGVWICVACCRTQGAAVACALGFMPIRARVRNASWDDERRAG